MSWWRRSRFTVIGFGLGKSSLDSQINVYQLTKHGPQQLMDFTTHADSGSMPGAVIAAPAGGAGGTAALTAVGVNVAADGLKAISSSTDMMTKRSANQAVAYMSQYFVEQGWIPQNLVKTRRWRTQAIVSDRFRQSRHDHAHCEPNTPTRKWLSSPGQGHSRFRRHPKVSVSLRYFT